MTRSATPSGTAHEAKSDADGVMVEGAISPDNTETGVGALSTVQENVGETDTKNDGDEVVTFADCLLEKRWVAEDISEWTIFEDTQDELEYHRRRSQALTTFVKAFIVVKSQVKDLRKENQHLNEIGGELQDAYVRILEEFREVAGDAAYWHELALAEGKQQCKSNVQRTSSMPEVPTQLKIENIGMERPGHSSQNAMPKPINMPQHGTTEETMTAATAPDALATFNSIPTVATENAMPPAQSSTPPCSGQQIPGSGNFKDTSGKVEIMIEVLCKELAALKKMKGINQRGELKDRKRRRKSPRRPQATSSRESSPASPPSAIRMVHPSCRSHSESPRRQQRHVVEHTPPRRQQECGSSSGSVQDMWVKSLPVPQQIYEPKMMQHDRHTIGVCRALFPPSPQPVPSSCASRATLMPFNAWSPNNTSWRSQGPNVATGCRGRFGGAVTDGIPNPNRSNSGSESTTAIPTPDARTPRSGMDAAPTTMGMVAAPTVVAMPPTILQGGNIVVKYPTAMMGPSLPPQVNIGPPMRHLSVVHSASPRVPLKPWPPSSPNFVTRGLDIAG